MKWIKWVAIGLALALLIGIGGLRLLNRWGNQDLPAESYHPTCLHKDVACDVWASFRRDHPYPYQTVAAAPQQDGSLILIISEPPPSISKDRLDHLVGSLFGNTVLSEERLRWYIGVDGWLEDLVLHTKAPNGANSLESGSFRDRVALLDDALFGTTYGGGFERLDEETSQDRSLFSVASNLDISPREVREWMSKNAISWQRLNDETDEPRMWKDLQDSRIIGTFSSTDGALVMLTFPTSLLRNAQLDIGAIEGLRIPFRQFAVASQSIFGGVWNLGGQTAILGRIRTRPVTSLPPLRFETFALLASQSSDELSQSYERNAIFAGKLQNGQYLFKDWAPVYLSGALIDTELGALLNITDQMLKSWSEAGNIEYLYFTYPKPQSFPFHNKALSGVLNRKFKSHSVLFNWNTSGSAVIVKGDDFSVLTAQKTGALPVTYGANGKPTAQGGENVFSYENEAYNYFATLRNPNLARVVQYTVLYQLLRAVAKDYLAQGVRDPIRRNAVTQIPQRSASTKLLVQETLDLLNGVDSHKVTEPRDLIEREVQPKLNVVKSQNPDFSNAQLASILADRFSSEATAYQEARERAIESKQKQLELSEKAINRDVRIYNQLAAGSSLYSSATILKYQSLPELRASIEQRRSSLDHEMEAFKNEEQEDPIGNLREAMNVLAQQVSDLDTIRMQFIKLNCAEPPGSIKTPSAVLSWNRQEELSSEGGHNLDSRAVRFEPSANVSDLTVENDGSVAVIRYNPSQAEAVETNAATLAREVEHGQVDNPEALRQLIRDARPIRKPEDAVELATDGKGSSPRSAFAIIGSRVYEEKIPFVEDLNGIAEQNDCCVFIAADDQQISYVAQKNALAPPPVVTYEIRDTPSLVEYLRARAQAAKSADKPIVFLDQPDAHVEALFMSLGDGSGGGGDVSDLVALIAGEPPDPPRTSGLVQDDFDGTRSVLNIFVGSEGKRPVDLLRKLITKKPRSVWVSASVTRLAKEEISAILTTAGWNEARDGFPTAVKVSLGTKEDGEISLVAGFERSGSSVDQNLINAHNYATNLAADQAGSLSQYLLTVKNRLKKHSDAKLRRLLMVVQDNETKTLLTQLQRDNRVPRGE